MSWHYPCPVCEAENCTHAVIAGSVKLLPCPFREGPPVPFATSQVHGFKGFGRDGALVGAYVFCHECGAQGPHESGLLYDADEVPALVEKAVLLWNTRNARHRKLYDHGEARGLNYHPRLEQARTAQ